ncbi:zinc-binding dehydrogenase [Pseudonocardia kujensis]|uniref:zinc-binding dehydrogenase n=1 Tax=Pseudonocardia kujensis TaxID=1128675 RepID=UPI001E5005CD|nr:zinc-binding dehydrogenase [Pseudonocardia kujensis]MCE0767910.1 zinc-binding dehydrogenase [Pseudonocardia kujensis]
MKAVVWNGPGDIALSDVPDPTPRDPGDAVVRLTVSAVCGTDLHMVRGTMPGMRPGTVLGHEGVGVVEAVASAGHLGATRVIVVDDVADRLEKARRQHVEPVDFTAEDPVEVIRELTGGIGVDRVIDAVGVDAYAPADSGTDDAAQRTAELEQVSGGGPTAWNAGDAPSQAARWAVRAVAKAGSIGIVGVYPQTAATYPIGEVMSRNLTVKAGNCPHRALMPTVIDLIASGALDAGRAVTKQEGMTGAIEAYETFDRHQPGWTKVVVDPAA